jgi:Protein of unknown function (DUF2957)
MRYAISKGIALALATSPLFLGCGGNASDPGPINAPQCSGATCGSQGAPGIGAGAAPLCPANADIVKSTYLGGAGSGEVLSVNIDAVNMTYTLKWLESPVPLAAGEVNVTRAGTTVTGAVVHPPAGTLPTAEQTRCAFVLTPASGKASDGSTYTTLFNAANPPMVFVGLGVAGGGIPGATVQFNGVDLTGLGLPGTVAFPVAQRTFDFYPFIGFSSTSTNVADLAGSYNSLLYHITPSNKYKATVEVAQETFDAAGNCSLVPGQTYTQCQTTGGAWTLNANGTYLTSTLATPIQGKRTSGTVLDLAYPTGFPTAASANMILGKLNGQTVPIIVRTGKVVAPASLLQLTSAVADDESGIAMLAPLSAIQPSAVNGGYVGADSNFKYTATLLQNNVGSFINPSTAAPETGFGLDYAVTHVPGLIGVQTQQGAQGALIAAGGLYGVFFNGATVNGGPTASSTNADTTATPYFGIGAQISK